MITAPYFDKKTGRYVYVPRETGFPVSANMRIRIDGYCLATGVVLRVRGMQRVFKHDGSYEYNPFSYRMPLTDLGVINQLFFPLADGELISLSVSSENGTAQIRPGDCFVRAWVVYGGAGQATTINNPATSTPASPIVAALFADYVSTLGYVSYPGSGIIPTLPENGSLVTIVPALGNPGDNLGFLIPDNQEWRVLKMVVNLIAGGVPIPSILFSVQNENGEFLQQWRTADDLPDSVTYKFYWSETGFQAGAPQTGATLGTTTAPVGSAAVNGIPRSGIVAQQDRLATNNDLVIFHLGGNTRWRSGYNITSDATLGGGDEFTAWAIQIQRWVVPGAVTE